MEEYTSNQSVDELLEAHSRWHYDRTDRNGTRYFWDNTCPRCGGTGHLHGYEYVQGGICFKCEGSGVVEKPRTIKVYTEAHGAKLKAGREARAQQKEIERLEKARASRGEWLSKLGFGNEDGTYVLYMVKGNTYSIKDELKALGCKFQPSIGWYSAQPLDGYECQRFTEDQVVDKSQEYSIVWKDKSEIEAQKEYEPSASEWVGEVGERIEKVFHFDKLVWRGAGVAGKTSYMWLMSDEDGNAYKWSTSCYYEEGDAVKLRATVKDHSEYKGTKQTVVTRCTAVK